MNKRQRKKRYKKIHGCNPHQQKSDTELQKQTWEAVATETANVCDKLAQWIRQEQDPYAVTARCLTEQRKSGRRKRRIRNEQSNVISSRI